MNIKPRPEALKKERLRKVMTVNELAEKSGICAATVTNLENGKHPAQPGTAKKLCEALDGNFSDLFTIEK